ncbi:MAG TPA: cupin domain-containing protein [Solirubrobacteraceae bacterium]|nr:cupin domain-containing protein [Solirubrobacteraceae bacterium]
MAKIQSKSLAEPEEVRPFQGGTGQVELVTLDSGPVGRGTFGPGWKWSDHVKPIAGTDSCQVHHLGWVASGRMRIVMDDGSEVEVGPGDVFDIPAGHDAWTVGDEPCVMIDFGGLRGYAVGS